MHYFPSTLKELQQNDFVLLQLLCIFFTLYKLQRGCLNKYYICINIKIWGRIDFIRSPYIGSSPAKWIFILQM